MTARSCAPALVRADHSGCVRRDGGWDICLGGATDGTVSLIRGSNRLRLVVIEALPDRWEGEHVTRRLSAAARLLATRGATLKETADELTAASGAPADCPPRAMVMLADLFDDGTFGVVCRFAPSMIHVTARGLDLLPTPPGHDEGGGRLLPDGRLLACSGSFLGAVEPSTLVALPAYARETPRPCQLWRQLAAQAKVGDRGAVRLAVAARAGVGGY